MLFVTFHVMPVVRMHMDSAEALAESYDGAADQVRNAMAELSPLMTEALALLDMPGQNPVHGPTPALTETANGLDEDGADLSWRVDLLRSTDAQPLGVTGRVMAFAPDDLGSSFERAGLTKDQVELAEDMVRNGVQFAHATQAAKSSNLDTTLDRLRLTELNARIDDWSGSDNDPILDLLLAERRELETRIAERDREIDSQYAAFRRQEAKSWASPRWTPLETAEHSLTQISTILDTAKHDRGRGVGATVADGIWSTEDLETVIANEHGYYTTTQIAHAQNVLAMANSSPEARSHLGITQSGEGWTFTEVAHLTLDVFGMVPIVGNAADGINAAWYAAEGQYLDAALSSIALIPGLGQIIAPARQAIRTAANGRTFRSLDDALAWTKTWIESTGLWRFSDETVRGADSAANVANHQRHVDELRRMEIEGTPGPEAARRAADEALASGQTSGAAAQLEVDGQIFVDTSRSSTPLHSSVDEALESIPESQRSPWHGRCAEPRCISQAIDAGLDVSDGAMEAVQIGSPARIPHGNLRPPCTSCAGLQRIFGYRQ